MRVIDGSASAEQAMQRLSEWGPKSYAYQKIGDVLFTSTVKADLAGQMLVRDNIDKRIQLSAPKREPAFLDKPWEDALAYFRNRVPSNQNELSTLLRGYAQRADVARLLMLKQIRDEVNAQLEKSLKEGSTYQEFARALANGEQSLGITNADPHYLKMVFRTNLQSAYGAGRFKALMDPVVQNARPIVGYRTVGDARVGEDHKPLDDTYYYIASNTWHRICPPNRPNCRCSMVAMTREEAEGKEILGEVPKDFIPNPDFDSPPTARIPISALTKDEQQEAKRPVQIGVPDKLIPETIAKEPEQKRKAAAPASKSVFTESELDALAGKQAELPSGLNVDTKVEESGDATRIVGAVKNDKGDVVGNFTRTFERDGNELNVRHGFFGLDAEQQGKGIGRQLFNAQVDAYEQHGINRVSLDAEQVGRYVWTKAGFEWDDPEQVQRVLGKLNDLLREQYGADVASKVMALTKTPQDIARLVIGGKPVGKDFLIGLEDEIIGMSQTPSKIRRL